MLRVLLLIAGCILHSAAFAESLPVVCQEFPPYNYLGADGLVTGSSTEIIVEVLRRMGYEADIRLLPWNRAYRMTVDGEAAFLYTFSISAEREPLFYFTEALASVAVVFFKRRVDPIVWNSLSDLKTLRIGYVEGYNYGWTMMQALQMHTFENADPIPASDQVDYQQLRKLANHRIDLAVCPKTQCAWIIAMKSPELDGLNWIDKPIGPPRDFYGGFSKRWPGAQALRDQFDKTYNVLIEEGRRDAIFRKYNLID